MRKDSNLQDLYAEARRRGLTDKDPELKSLLAEAVKRGMVDDLSQPPKAKAAPAPAPSQGMDSGGSLFSSGVTGQDLGIAPPAAPRVSSGLVSTPAPVAPVRKPAARVAPELSVVPGPSQRQRRAANPSFDASLRAEQYNRANAVPLSEPSSGALASTIPSLLLPAAGGLAAAGGTEALLGNLIARGTQIPKAVQVGAPIAAGFVGSGGASAVGEGVRSLTMTAGGDKAKLDAARANLRKEHPILSVAAENAPGFAFGAGFGSLGENLIGGGIGSATDLYQQYQDWKNDPDPNKGPFRPNVGENALSAFLGAGQSRQNAVGHAIMGAGARAGTAAEPLALNAVRAAQTARMSPVERAAASSILGTTDAPVSLADVGRAATAQVFNRPVQMSPGQVATGGRITAPAPKAMRQQVARNEFAARRGLPAPSQSEPLALPPPAPGSLPSVIYAGADVQPGYEPPINALTGQVPPYPRAPIPAPPTAPPVPIPTRRSTGMGETPVREGLPRVAGLDLTAPPESQPKTPLDNIRALRAMPKEQQDSVLRQQSEEYARMIEPLNREQVERAIQQSPTPDFDSFVAETVKTYAPLLRPNEKITPQQLAQRIAEDYDLGNPRVKVDYSALMNASPGMTVSGKMESVTQRGRFKGNMAGADVTPPSADLAPAAQPSEPVAPPPTQATRPTAEPTAPTRTTEPPAVREPWQMTRDEWARAEFGPTGGGGKYSRVTTGHDPSMWPVYERLHRKYVSEAVAAGKPVPAEVLAQYPDLAAQSSAATPAATPVAPAEKPSPYAMGAEEGGNAGAVAPRKVATSPSLIAEAESLINEIGTPLYRSILKAELAKAKAGEPNELQQYVEQYRPKSDRTRQAIAARDAEDAARSAEAGRQAIAGRTDVQVEREIAALTQQRDRVSASRAAAGLNAPGKGMGAKSKADGTIESLNTRIDRLTSALKERQAQTGTDAAPEFPGIRPGTRTETIARELKAEGNLSYSSDRNQWSAGPFTGKTAGEAVRAFLANQEKVQGKYRTLQERRDELAGDIRNLERQYTAIGKGPEAVSQKLRDNLAELDRKIAAAHGTPDGNSLTARLDTAADATPAASANPDSIPAVRAKAVNEIFSERDPAKMSAIADRMEAAGMDVSALRAAIEDYKTRPADKYEAANKKGNSLSPESYFRYEVTNAAGRVRKAKASTAEVLDSIEQAAKDRIAARTKRGSQSLGTTGGQQASDFVENIADYAVIAAAKMARGVTDTAKLAKEMVKEFGNEIRPHLKGIFEQAGRILNEREAFRKYDTQRRIDELVAAADKERSWKDWYGNYQGTLTRIFGDDSPLFQKLLAATSQAASVPANVGLAIKAYRQLLSGEVFTGYLPAVIKNLERIRNEEQLAGRKIGQYGNAVEGDAEGIAVDRHIARLLFGDNVSRPSPQQIEAAKQAIRIVADRLGWEPRQVQAALWAYNQTRNGGTPASYDTYLEKRADEIAALRAAFSRGEGGSISSGGTTDAGIAEPPAGSIGGSAETGAGQQPAKVGQRPVNPVFTHLDDLEQVIRANIEAKKKAGPDPSAGSTGGAYASHYIELGYEYAKLAAVHAAKLGVKGGEWSARRAEIAAQMVKDWGEDIKPHLAVILRQAQEIYEKRVRNGDLSDLVELQGHVTARKLAGMGLRPGQGKSEGAAGSGEPSAVRDVPTPNPPDLTSAAQPQQQQQQQSEEDKKKQGAFAASLQKTRDRAEQDTRINNVMSPEPNRAFEEAMSAVPDAVANRFLVHGIETTGGDTSIEDHLLRFLTTGIDTSRSLHDGNPKRGDIGSIGARTTAPYLLLSDPGKTVRETGVKHVIVNDGAAGNIPALKKAFPGVNFIPAEEAGAYMRRLLQGGKQGATASQKDATGAQGVRGATGAATPAPAPDKAKDPAAILRGMTMADVEETASELGRPLPNRKEYADTWDAAKDRAMANYASITRDLEAADVRKTGALSQEEFIVANVNLRRLTDSEIPDLVKRIEAAQEKGDTDAVKQLSDKLDIAYQRVDRYATLAHKAGSEAGRRLALQKAMAEGPFDAPTLIRKARAAAGGKLSNEAVRTITGLAERAKRVHKNIDARYQAKAEEALRQMETADWGGLDPAKIRGCL